MNDITARINERADLEAELASPYRNVQLLERVASSIIRESLIEHVLADESPTEVICTCGAMLRLQWSSASTIRVHQAEASAAALAEFTAREQVSA